VVSDTFDNSVGSGVSDGESLGSDTPEVCLSRGCTVQADVADDDVLLRLESGHLGRVDDETASRETLSDVVVGVTLELDGDTRSHECTERLSSRTPHVDVDRVLGQTRLAVLLRDLVGQRGTERSIGVDDVALDLDWRTVGDGLLGLVDELVVKTDVETVVLLAALEGGSSRSHLPCGLEDGAEVEVLGLCIPERVVDLEVLGMANHLVDSPEAKLGHDASKLLGDVVEEVNDLLGLASELGSQLWVLRGDSDGAGVEVALPHHDASHRNQGCCSEAPLFSTKQAGNGDIPAGPDLPVSLDGDSASEIVENERLMRLCKSKLPWETGVLDTGPARSTRASVVTGDEDVVGLGLCDTRCDNSNSDLGDELDRHPRPWVRALEVVDELLQILDGVDVVVGRRRDETDSRGGVPGFADRLGHLVAW